MAILNGKKVVIIGDRDGIPGPSIEACVKTANKFSINNTIIELTQFYDELIKGINNDSNKKFN